MGYHTKFKGEFRLSKPLTADQAAYLQKFSRTRRMARDPARYETRDDLTRMLVLLPLGDECAYYTGSTADFGQDHDPGIIDYNRPPIGQPSLWCQWVPTEDGSALRWNEAEKFYSYVGWANYLLDHFLLRWGIAFESSDVKYRGEEFNDVGSLVINEAGRVVRGQTGRKSKAV